MRIMFDTNLFISAILFPESVLARNVFEAAEKFSLVLSSQIIDELRAVIITPVICSRVIHFTQRPQRKINPYRTEHSLAFFV